LNVRAAPDGSECTTVSYDSAEKSVTVDGRRSSLDLEVDRLTFSGRLSPDQNGVVRFRAFFDRSVLEVFLADQACITQRLYPTREDSLGVSFAVKKGSIIVHCLTAWKLASIWPRSALSAK
jgi:beta-fructofuranosidase